MKTIGLLGKQLSHSFSKEYFTSKFKQLAISDNWEYKNFELDSIDQLDLLIATHKPIGFNVTLPYKQTILPFLKNIDNIAQQIGAINTVKVSYLENNQYELKGYNTDAHGFHQLIKPFLEQHHERALILGNGGASKAVQYVLKNYGIPYLIATRNPNKLHHNEISWNTINEYIIKHHMLLINTTPIGMFPNIETYPNIPYNLLTPKHLLIDLVYNPTSTLFIQKGKANSTATLNGITMLHQQAEKAWQLFNS